MTAQVMATGNIDCIDSSAKFWNFMEKIAENDLKFKLTQRKNEDKYGTRNSSEEFSFTESQNKSTLTQEDKIILTSNLCPKP